MICSIYEKFFYEIFVFQIKDILGCVVRDNHYVKFASKSLDEGIGRSLRSLFDYDAGVLIYLWFICVRSYATACS